MVSNLNAIADQIEEMEKMKDLQLRKELLAHSEGIKNAISAGASYTLKLSSEFRGRILTISPKQGTNNA